MLKFVYAKKWPTLMMLVAMAVLLALGSWQVKRLAWKTGMLQHIEMRMSDNAVPLPEVIKDVHSWDYRRVTLAGRFLHSYEFLLQSRVMQGKSGYHMLVPFRRVSGGIVFINRGWISNKKIDNASRPEGVVQVEGVVQLPEKGRYIPNNNIAKNQWYWNDIDAMAKSVDIDAPLPVIISVSKKVAGVYPAGGQVHLNIANNHRYYAVFWFFMAFVLCVIYTLWCWKEVKDGTLQQA